MGPRILVVDDSPWMRMTLLDILKDQGWENVEEARNGREAVSQYETLEPDIVLMDITMPYMDGVQAVKAIKQLDRHALIVMCSALGQRDTVVEAIQAGAKGFVVKPFKKVDVIDAVNKALAAAGKKFDPVVKVAAPEAVASEAVAEPVEEPPA